MTQPGSNVRVGNGAGGCTRCRRCQRRDQARVHLARHRAVGAGLVHHARYPEHRVHDRPARRVLRRRRGRDQGQHEVRPGRRRALHGEARRGCQLQRRRHATCTWGGSASTSRKDIRVTVEGMLVNEQSLAGSNLGDTFWVGATVGAKLGTVQARRRRGLRAAAVRVVAASVGLRRPVHFQESGFGAFVTAQVPIGPLNVFGVGWYTTGDDQVGPAGCGLGVGCRQRNQRRLCRSGYCPCPEQGFRQAPDSGVRRWLVRRRRPVHRGVDLR